MTESAQTAMSVPGVAPGSEAAVLAPREQVLAQIPAWYSGVVHLVVVLALGAGFLLVPLAFIHDVATWELAMVPVALVFANALEWHIHRGPLHHPVTPRILYRRHTLTHHAAYSQQDMHMRSTREFRFVLFPPFALPLLELLIAPIPVTLWHFGQRNLAMLFVATGAFYYLLYELLHLAYHLPADHPVSRSAWLRRLSRHHAAHHDPRRMTRGNFNVSIPLWDAVRGTVLPGADDAST